MVLPHKIAVVIPCHNEAAAITLLVQEIKKHLPHILVIDDGSLDDTGKNARAAGAEVIRNETATGKGAALRAGWKAAQQKGFEFALAMDGDGQHSPNDIPKFLAAVDQAPLIIGNRMGERHKMPWLRRFVNGWMSRRLSRAAGRELVDTQCGFRLMDLKVWSTLQLQTTHFEIESEMLLAFIAAGHNVHFVPIEVIYKTECSKIRPVRDTVRWFQWFLRISKIKRRTSNEDSSAGKSVVPTKAASLAEHV